MTEIIQFEGPFTNRPKSMFIDVNTNTISVPYSLSPLFIKEFRGLIKQNIDFAVSQKNKEVKLLEFDLPRKTKEDNIVKINIDPRLSATATEIQNMGKLLHHATRNGVLIQTSIDDDEPNDAAKLLAKYGTPGYRYFDNVQTSR